MIRHNLPIDIVLWLASLQKPQRFGQVVVEDHRFVPQLADQQVLLLHFFFKGKESFCLFACGFKLSTEIAGVLGRGVGLFA